MSVKALIERICVEGRVEITHFDKVGEIIEFDPGNNLIVDAGLALIAGRINGAGSLAAADYIALGTGTTGAAAGDVILEAEITTGGGDRTQGTVSRITTTVTNDTATVTVTFNFTASHAITEVGLLNAASSGTLLARRVFSVKNVSNGESLQVQWKIPIS